MESSTVAHASSPATSFQDKKILDTPKKKLQEFESVFLQIMLEIMFKEISFNPMKSGDKPSNGDDIYKSWMIEQYAKDFAGNETLGLADAILPSFLRLQENSKL